MSPTTLLDGNRRWVLDRTRHDPEFFARSAREHRPTVFYLGCSDARVPDYGFSKENHGLTMVY